jgi:hypothetical protein
VILRIRQSGKKRFTKGPAIPLGNARLRKSLFMWFYKWCGVIRGCGSITNGSEPQGNQEKLPSSPQCESCLLLCGVWRLTADPSCR